MNNVTVSAKHSDYKPGERISCFVNLNQPPSGFT